MLLDIEGQTDIFDFLDEPEVKKSKPKPKPPKVKSPEVTKPPEVIEIPPPDESQYWPTGEALAEDFAADNPNWKYRQYLLQTNKQPGDGISYTAAQKWLEWKVDVWKQQNGLRQDTPLVSVEGWREKLRAFIEQLHN